jgi:hypothetical protein
MGLAAGQARLLSITARKSDCEFRSMSLSHQKISLARQLADLSNEYQNSLDQSKLIYDYYGTGDTNTPLSYGILMSPSALNDYMPTTITDSIGRVVLNNKYASAARAAGIPQEGLGTLPSEAMRNAFILAMESKGIISANLSDTILGLPYNQEAGFGGGTTVSVVTKQGNISDLIQALKENGQSIDISLDGVNTEGVDSAWFQLSKNGTVTDLNSSDKNVSLTLSDLLSNDDTYISFGNQKTGEYAHENLVTSAKNILSTVLDATYEQLASLLDLGDGYTTKALDYARTETEKLFLPSVDNLRNEEYRTFVGKGNTNNASSENNQNYMGFVYVKGESSMFKSSKPKAAVNINNMAKAFLTFFVKYMDGVASKDADGSDKYKVQIGHLSENKLATSDYLFQYSIKTGTEVSSDDLAQATFYDALFNQICKNGWSENENISDSSYLQQMLQNGMLFISKMKDDGYYYQGNYATDPYIKEISDETAIAQAESKYTTEKAKLNTKEETLDLKMKNLDTEISSLTTEYDTVKNTISKNIEKSFKRYSA